ncbi:MAG: sugar transferase [Thermodesulfobacteriota bacterium]
MKRITVAPKIEGKSGLGPESSIFLKPSAFWEEKEKLSQPGELVFLDTVGSDDCFLSPDEFRVQLQREKRRVERSSTPLSIVLFQLNQSVLGNGYQIRTFLEAMKTRTRETDIKGWIDTRTVGAILLDTNGLGMDRCVSSIIRGNDKLISSIITGSFPDSLFEELLDESKPAPDLFIFDLDQPSSRNRVSSFCKRGLDLCGALMALTIFAPFMIITALAIKGTSPGPIIFKQIRIGRRGKRFHFYKFRSMVAENDDRIHREYVTGLIEGSHEKSDQGDGARPFYKIKHDDRITPLGRFIRRLSIDELPQLFNVLKGEMSLVGPRPPIPYEVEKYKPWHLRRILEIKPGITGLWQVEGRSRTSFNEMVRLDLRYIKKWSLWLDIKILLKTVKVVLGTKGAV